MTISVARRLLSTVAAAGICLFYVPRITAIEEPDCTQTVSIRWASSTDRLYLESSFNSSGNVPAGTPVPTGGGCTNLSAIVDARTDNTGYNKGPVYHYNLYRNMISAVHTGNYYINSSLYIEDNVWLDISSPAYGGDVTRVLLRSDETKFITMRAYGGRLTFNGVVVRSHDPGANNGRGGPDENVDDGRSFVAAISEIVKDESLNCTGMAKKTMGEARLDIHNSTFAYLGYYASESYGISYKVRGLCQDKSNVAIMDEVAVWGDITDSEIKFLYFGHYSYGHQGGNWSGNHVHHNHGYGFDPHDDSDYVIISNNHVHHNGWHGIIASKRCDHAIISNNLVHDNGYNGIMLHRSCDFAHVSGNEAYNNGDAGIALYESSSVEVYDNVIHSNPVAIRLSMGSSYCNMYDNVFNTTDMDNYKYSVFMYRGSDEPNVAGSDGTPIGNQFSNNIILSPYEAAKIIETASTSFEGNYFSGDFARFRNSTDVAWRDNDVESVFTLKLEGNTCFAEGQASNFVPVCE